MGTSVSQVTDTSGSSMQDKIDDLRDRQQQAINAGSPRSVERHKGKGKVEDLEKAKHYLEYLIENYEEIYAPE